jgi:hypothetical protein
LPPAVILNFNELPDPYAWKMSPVAADAAVMTRALPAALGESTLRPALHPT